MLILFTIWLGLAHADAQQDLTLAADLTAGAAVRQEAFARLVTTAATDQNHLLEISRDEDEDTRLRWVAIRALGESGGVSARRVLLDLIHDNQPAIRAAAAAALGDMGGDAGAALTECLRDPAIIVRSAAAVSLGRLRDPHTVTALEQALLSDDNYYRGSSLWVRRQYVEALGDIASSKALPAMVRALDDSDPDVASAAVDSLEKIGGFSFSEGRSYAEEREAWRRWANARIQSGSTR